MANAEKIRIRLKAYDHSLIDQASEKIVEAAKRTNAKVSGPIPLPTEREVVTILRAVHKVQGRREQFEQPHPQRLIRHHRRRQEHRRDSYDSGSAGWRRDRNQALRKPLDSHPMWADSEIPTIA